MGQPPTVIIAGWSGSGKTTLVEKLIPELRRVNLRVGTVKHHHGNFEIDKPGKDSWRHRQAGAARTIISSPSGIGIMMNVDHEPCIDELLPFMDGMDIVVVEGYKEEKKPKIEVFRSAVHEKPRFLNDPDLIALASDVEMSVHVPVFNLERPDKLADFIIEYFTLSPAPVGR